MEDRTDQEPAAPGPRPPAGKRKGRVYAAYATVAALAVIALAAVLALSSGSDSAARGNPHINLESGITNGITPDNRAGVEPPAFDGQSLQTAARAAGCELRLRLPDEGHDHIAPTTPEPDYKTNPPTSGDHVDEQQADGAYRETPPPVSFVHSLEHGRLAIQYRPDLPEPGQLELIGLFDTIYGGTLLFPNPDMPYLVAATTWTNLLGCRTHRAASTLGAIQAFGKATWGRFGGESLIGINSASPSPGSP